MANNIIIKVEDHSKEFLEELARRVPVILEECGIQLEGEAKRELRNTPERIDTGLLRNSITHAVSGKAPAETTYHADHESKYGNMFGEHPMSGSYSGTAPNDPDNKMAVYIGTNVEYAPYVHEGFHLPSGKYVAPNHFLKNALDKNKKQVEQKIEEKLKQE